MGDDKAEALTAALEAYAAQRIEQARLEAYNAGIRAAYNVLIRESVSKFSGTAGYDADKAKNHFDIFEPAIRHLEAEFPALNEGQ